MSAKYPISENFFIVKTRRS